MMNNAKVKAANAWFNRDQDKVKRYQELEGAMHIFGDFKEILEDLVSSKQSQLVKDVAAGCDDNIMRAGYSQISGLKIAIDLIPTLTSKGK